MTTVATAVQRNPLDTWMAARIGIEANDPTPEAIRSVQLRAVQQTVAWARQRSAFYAARLAGLPAGWPHDIEDLAQIPLTSPEDIIAGGHSFVCVPQSEITRIVSLETSGTSGMRKRIFFTAEDQEQALDFFAYGVASMAGVGDRMLIAMPGEREGSVGFQIARGIARAGVTPIPHGFVVDPAATLARIEKEKVTLLIGLPVQMLALAQAHCGRQLRNVHTIVLCSDHVPQSLTRSICNLTGCRIFEHYGSTEMGLGGGVDCMAHAGYHLREADLYFEVVSPQTGEPVPDGEAGEVVFTTIARRAMPLIRYRTGDLSRFLPGPCACGSPLRRLERVRCRVQSSVILGPQGSVTLADLDEALFAIEGLGDFQAAVVQEPRRALEVRVYAAADPTRVAAQVERALHSIPAIAANHACGALHCAVHLQDEPFPVTGAKRVIGMERPR